MRTYKYWQVRDTILIADNILAIQFGHANVKSVSGTNAGDLCLVNNTKRVWTVL